MQSVFTTNKSALVTGASAGIGLELTRALAPRLDSLIVVARRVERLEQLAKELQSRFPTLEIAIEAADLSDPERVQLGSWLCRHAECRRLHRLKTFRSGIYGIPARSTRRYRNRSVRSCARTRRI